MTRRRRGRILLLADTGRDGGGRDDADMADVPGAGASTGGRARRRFVLEGLEAALERKGQASSRKPVLDGGGQAMLACSEPPRGARAPDAAAARRQARRAGGRRQHPGGDGPAGALMRPYRSSALFQNLTSASLPPSGGGFRATGEVQTERRGSMTRSTTRPASYPVRLAGAGPVTIMPDSGGATFRGGAGPI